MGEGGATDANSNSDDGQTVENISSTQQTNGVVTVTLPEPGDAIPEQPQNLRGSVYSPTAMEVFWDRGVAGYRYRVALNGQIVDNIDGTSFFFDGLQSGGRYVVDVMTIAPNNRISRGSTLVLQTP